MQNDDRVGFIIGHYKSGSTWLAHLLSLVPGVIGVRECHVFRYAHTEPTLEAASARLFQQSAWSAGGSVAFPRHWASSFTRPARVKLGLAKGYASLPGDSVPTALQDLGLWRALRLRRQLASVTDPDEYIQVFYEALLKRYEPARYLIEKTPTNIFEIDNIARLYPRSPLISIHRDGRDVVISDFHHVKRSRNREEDFTTRVQKWVRAMQAEVDAAQNHNIIQLSYEDLTDHPCETFTMLLDRLGIQQPPVAIESMVQAASFEASTGGRRARGVEDQSLFFRKGIVGEWRETFTNSEKEEFSELAGQLLVRFGYETSPDWRDW